MTVSLPDPSTMYAVATAVVAFLAGMAVPTAYGLERLNGFGRWMADKLPYRAPPGMDEEEALAQAAEDGGERSPDVKEQR